MVIRVYPSGLFLLAENSRRTSVIDGCARSETVHNFEIIRMNSMIAAKGWRMADWVGLKEL